MHKRTIFQFAIAKLVDNACNANSKTFKIFQIPTLDYKVKFFYLIINSNDLI